MIDIAEVEYRAATSIDVAQLVIVLDVMSVWPALTAKNEDGDLVLIDLDSLSNFAPRLVQPGQHCLLIGKPVVQFDHEYALKSDEVPSAGSLIIDREGWGFYIPVRPTENRIATLDGRCVAYRFAHPAKAFRRWAIGYMRDQEFVFVAGR